MRMTKRIFCGLLFLCLLLFTGCGEKMKELTTEEEDIISMYAAKVVAKHNVRLGQGIMRYRGKIEDDEEDASDETLEDGAEDAASQEGVEETVGETTAASTEGITVETAESQAETIPQATLTEALGINGVRFVYDGVSVPESLRLSSYYTLPDPQAGRTYVIAAFDAVNESESPITISIAERSPRFTASLNGETANAGMVLDQDLMTYAGTIDAGGSEHLILLFDFSENAASDLSDFGITADVDGTKSQLTLNQ